MGLISTGLLLAGARSEFAARLAAAPNYYQRLATRIPSDKAAEAYQWLGSVPQMQQWIDERQAKGLRSESYDVTNLKYENSISVDRDELADDQTGQIMIRIQEMAQRAGSHKDFLIAQLLDNGGTAGWLSYDGVTFFNDTHSSGSSGNQDNNLTLAATTGTSPTVAEMQQAIKDGITAILGFKDDQGEPMTFSADGFTIVTPPVYYFTALEAVSNPLVLATLAPNVLANVAPTVICLPWLTTTTQIFTCKTDGVIRPFVFQDREPITFDAVDMNSEQGKLKHKLLYGCWARYRMTYGYWQYCVRTTFT